MENIQEQIQDLQASVRRQRFANVALASLLAGSVLLGAVSPAGDATFDTITCKEWRVVDKDGKTRILANTAADGNAGVMWRDKDGKVRIAANTNAKGLASVGWFDKDGKVRIGADTDADGNAGVMWLDKDGKVRIDAATEATGFAAVTWFDKDGKVRILANTEADGTVVYPTKSGD